MIDDTEWVPLATAATHLNCTVADIHDLVSENLIPVKHEDLNPIASLTLVRIRDIRAYWDRVALDATAAAEVSQSPSSRLTTSSIKAATNMFNFLHRKAENTPALTITVTEGDDHSDLEALGVDDIRPVNVHVEGDLCECAQVQILARLLAEAAESDHVIDKFGPEVAAMFQAPHRMFNELVLRAAAREGSDEQ